MSVIRNLGKNIRSMFGELVEVDDFVKLIANNDRDCLNEDKPNVSLPQLIEDRKLVPMPKIPETEEESSSFVCIYLKRLDQAGNNNTYQYDAQLIVDVVCHVDAWMLKDGKVRPYELLDILDDKLPNYANSSIRGSLVAISPAEFISYNKKFFGYRCMYSYTDSSNRLCKR